MSEIPFVNQLGDALDAAIAKQPARAPRIRRLGRRRYLAVALAALTVGGAGAAVATLSTDPVEIGFGAVGCFEGQDVDGGAAVTSDPNREPVEICADVLAGQGLTATDLIACHWEGHGVVVMPHEGRRSCAALELAPLPPSYTGARLRASRLQAVAVEFERDAGCLAPGVFARRLTAELRRRGWTGWRAVADGGGGPCGRVSVPTGSSLTGSIGPAVDAGSRTIDVKGRAPLRLELMLTQPGSPGSRLFDTSGERCFTLAGLEKHVRRVLAFAKAPINFRSGSLHSYAEVTGPRGDRYTEGCAIYEGAFADYSGGRVEIVVDLSQRDAPLR
jgi:hypothetical protein